MKFKVTQKIDAPGEAVWQRMTQFERWERLATERGARVTRTGAMNGIGIGSGWRGTVDLRGRQRDLEVTLTDLARPERMEIEGQIGGMEVEMFLAIETVAAAQSRLTMVLELKARTLTARLLLQSVKLARGRVLGRLEKGLQTFGHRVETAHKKHA